MSNEEESVSVSSGRLHFLEDVPQSIQVEVARSEIPLKTVMTWKKDTIVEFKKIAGDSVEVLIGDQLINLGIGEAVFDRGGYVYHGRVKALADGIREKGINF